MRDKPKRKVAALLALLALLSSLSACTDSENSQSKSQADTSLSSGENESVSNTDYSYIDSYVSALASGTAFDGVEFNIVGREDSILTESKEETGNLESSALYYRSRELEELFDINMTLSKATGIGFEDAESEINELVRLDVMSDSRTYDLIEGNIMLCGTVMLEEDLIRPSDDFPDIDTERSWWISDIHERYTICDKLYYLTGKINLSHYSAPACILYNKAVAENFNLPDLYEAVENGTWTLDFMTESASAITGSDIKRYMIGGAGGGLSMFFGGGFTLADIDENGDPVLTETLTSDMVSYIDRLADIFGDDSTTYNQVRAYYNGAEEFTDHEVFENGGVLYWIDVLGCAVGMRSYDVEFGILPIPKRDTSQKDYVSFANAWQVVGVFFPKNVKDEQLSGVVTEAMAALSEKYIEPAYLTKSLKGRSTYDEPSRDVVDMLYGNQTADLADTYQWGDLVKTVNFACLGSIDSYVSGYSSAAKFAKITVNRLLASVKSRNTSR